MGFRELALAVACIRAYRAATAAGGTFYVNRAWWDQASFIVTDRFDRQESVAGFTSTSFWSVKA